MKEHQNSKRTDGLDKVLFFVAPIGKDDSPERKRSDEVLNGIVKPAAEALGLRGQRADEITEGGKITSQIVRRLLGAKLVVSDLTGLNANVFYEIAVRDSFRLPQILIAEKGTKLPFDLNDQRTIWLDHTSITNANSCKDMIIRQGKKFLEDPSAVESLITGANEIASLSSSDDSGDRVLAELLEQVQDISRKQQQLVVKAHRESETVKLPPAVFRDLARLTGILDQLIGSKDADEDDESLKMLRNCSWAIQNMIQKIEYDPGMSLEGTRLEAER